MRGWDFDLRGAGMAKEAFHSCNLIGLDPRTTSLELSVAESTYCIVAFGGASSATTSACCKD